MTISNSANQNGASPSSSAGVIAPRTLASSTPAYSVGLLAVAGLLCVAFYRPFMDMKRTWGLTDSYYSHGYLIPFICLFLVWRERKTLLSLPIRPALGGFGCMFFSAFMLLMGDYLGFGILNQFALVPMLAGVVWALLGRAHLVQVWFVLVFLCFMIPLPTSLTASVTFHLKMLATEKAVNLAQLLFIPMIQEGSFVIFGDDRLLVGDVCGGLRSLIALLALGALMSYLSKGSPWTRIALLVLAPPIAIVTNVLRIFGLCVIAYFFGSESATGWVHDVSGFMIFVVAISFFMLCDVLLAKLSPPKPKESSPPKALLRDPPGHRKREAWFVIIAIVILSLTSGSHLKILKANASVAISPASASVNTVASKVGGFVQYGPDTVVSEDIKTTLETNEILMRAYAAPNGRYMQLTIVLAGASRRSLHFPEVCLRGQGWEIRDQYTAPAGLSFLTRRLVLVKGGQKEAVMYWFKVGDKFTESFYKNSLYWAYGQLSREPTVSGMIKVSTFVGPEGEEQAFEVLEEFAEALGPEVSAL